MTQKGPPPVMYDRPSVDLEPLFSAAGHLAGIDPMLLKAIAMRESSLNPGNWTPATGAVGLMSLESQNWRSLGVTDPWDPAQNIMGGALLLGDNLKMYDGDLNKALQQYNGGNPSRWGAATQSYVQTVRDNYKKLTGQQAPERPSAIHTSNPAAGPQARARCDAGITRPPQHECGTIRPSQFASIRSSNPQARAGGAPPSSQHEHRTVRPAELRPESAGPAYNSADAGQSRCQSSQRATRLRPGHARAGPAATSTVQPAAISVRPGLSEQCDLRRRLAAISLRAGNWHPGRQAGRAMTPVKGIQPEELETVWPRARA